MTQASLLEYLFNKTTEALLKGEHGVGDILIPFPHHGSYFEVGEDCIVHGYRDYLFPAEAWRFVAKVWIRQIVAMLKEHLGDFEFLDPLPKTLASFNGKGRVEGGKWKHIIYLTGSGLQSGRTAYALAKMLAEVGSKPEGLHIWDSAGRRVDECAVAAAEGALQSLTWAGKRR
jgi:hypothetical protein